MARISLMILAVMAALWMAFPTTVESGTEMGFVAGTPDPNVYKVTVELGWPLTWLSRERSTNEAAGYDETELGGFQFVNLMIHTLAIIIPLLAVYWVSKSGHFAKKENATGPEPPS